MATTDMSLQYKFPSRTIYDTAAEPAVEGVNANTSKVAIAPSAIQVDAVPASTTVKIQSRIHKDAEWIDEATLVGATGASITSFAVRRNFVRVIRSAGTGDIVAYAQD